LGRLTLPLFSVLFLLIEELHYFSEKNYDKRKYSLGLIMAIMSFSKFNRKQKCELVHEFIIGS